MKIYMQTNKATTNIFGLHTQPRKTSSYTNILKLVWGEGGGGGGGGGGKRVKLACGLIGPLQTYLVFIINLENPSVLYKIGAYVRSGGGVCTGRKKSQMIFIQRAMKKSLKAREETKIDTDWFKYRT